MATAAIPGLLDVRTAGLWGGLGIRRPLATPAPPKKPGSGRGGTASGQLGYLDARKSPQNEKPRGTGMGEINATPVPPEAPQNPARTQTQAQRAEVIAEQQALAELAARCLAGDAQAWEKLAKTQHRRVYGICYRFTNSQSEAEDLTQEAFLKMFRNMGSFDPAKGSFTTWLTTLTRNLLVDNYRRTRMERASDSLDETYDGVDDGPTKGDKLADGGKSQEERYAGLELRAQIQQALAQVSPDLREAVILRDLEDMDYKDIAEVLGVPQGTVKSRISRGRAELARLLKGLEGQVM
jgi:RNA polymerase sigma-70 factor (ECF subfamily)